MTAATQAGEAQAPALHKIERTAWGLISIAFGVFCAICAALGVGGYYFLFNSTVPMYSSLGVSRGILGVTGSDLEERVVRADRSLLLGERINVSSDAQGVLQFRDLSRSPSFIASLTLRSETRGTLNEASMPRFDFSVEGYRVEITNIVGDFDLLINEAVTRSVWFTLSTAGGDAVHLTRPGDYSVRTRGGVLEVTVFRGEALLVADDRINSRAIANGQRGLLVEQTNQVSSVPGYVDLLGSDMFVDDTILAVSADDLSATPRTPENWICYVPQQTSFPPRGTYGLETVDGRAAVRFVRAENATTHGETRCAYRLGPGALGVDISGYNYLALRVVFKISGSSLAACGEQGSECPLMLNMQYIPDGLENTPQVTRDPSVFGSIFDPLVPSPARDWYKGFYVQPALSGSPLRCSSCTQEHSALRSGEWYTFDSGNLLQLIPEDQQPRYLLNLSFYASGHQYDAAVSEIMLLVGSVALPPDANLPG